MEEIGAKRRAIRGAVWLWILLGVNAEQSEAEWWPVCAGGAISDERIAVNLDVSAAKAKKWRVRLEHLGMIRTEMVRPLNWKIWILNAERADAQKAPQTIPSPLSNLVH
jgi:hypothetical protein